jgi:hypothetical protein
LRATAAGTIAACAATILLGCSAEAERPLLERFFDLSRLRDRTALQQISTVIFEPFQDGIVTTVEIVRVTSEERGGIHTKSVNLHAPVKIPGGTVVHKTLVITMERRARGWIITGVASREI